MGCVQSNINDKDKDISVRKKTKILEHIDMYETHIKRRSMEHQRKSFESQQNKLRINVVNLLFSIIHPLIVLD